MKPVITLTITGPPASGASRLARILARFFRQADIPVLVRGDAPPPEAPESPVAVAAARELREAVPGLAVEIVARPGPEAPCSDS